MYRLGKHTAIKHWNYINFYVPWQITPASDLCVQTEFSVAAREQLKSEASEPMQVTPCKYTGFMFSIKPPLAAIAPETQSKYC